MLVNTQVKLVKYLGQGEAVVELNTGERVEIFYDPNQEEESDCLDLEDVTGTLGVWLECDTEDIPEEAIKLLQQAYNICAKELE